MSALHVCSLRNRGVGLDQTTNAAGPVAGAEWQRVGHGVPGGGEVVLRDGTRLGRELHLHVVPHPVAVAGWLWGDALVHTCPRSIALRSVLSLLEISIHSVYSM